MLVRRLLSKLSQIRITCVSQNLCSFDNAAICFLNIFSSLSFCCLPPPLAHSSTCHSKFNINTISISLQHNNQHNNLHTCCSVSDKVFPTFVFAKAAILKRFITNVAKQQLILIYLPHLGQQQLFHSDSCYCFHQ